MYTRADITKVFRLSANESEMKRRFSMEHFYPNVCSVCLSHDRETPLKRCKSCKMILYCSKDHQKKHWPLHKDACKPLSNLIMQGNSNQSNVFAGGFSIPELRNFMIPSLIYELEAVLGRELKCFESEMVSFPKVCEICRTADSDLLKACPNCPHANFCKQHAGDPKHKELCHLYTLCLQMDAYDLVFEDMKISDAVIKTTPLLTELTRLPSSISEIMQSYLKLKKFIIKYSKNMRKIVKTVKLGLLRNEKYFEGFFIHTTELFTRSLTLLYAMEKLNFSHNEKMVVHVIGANFRETGNLSEWELLLHWLPYLKNLKVVFVGPEVPQPDILSMVCSFCMLGNKELSFEFHRSLYKDYVIESCLVMPDIVVGYNTGIAFYDTWPDSIAIIKNFSCPLILTTFKEHEARLDRMVVNSILGAETSLFLEKNPFASLRPFRYRDFTASFGYRNISILIYNNFQKMSTEIKLPIMKSAKHSKGQDERSDLASSLPIEKF